MLVSVASMSFFTVDVRRHWPPSVCLRINLETRVYVALSFTVIVSLVWPCNSRSMRAILTPDYGMPAYANPRLGRTFQKGGQRWTLSPFGRDWKKDRNTLTCINK